MDPLPNWPTGTNAALTTLALEGPHTIPVSAPVRANEDTILISLHRTRDSLARLRTRPQIALLIQAEGIAFTARGTAQVAADPMSSSPDYTAVELNITHIDDHTQPTATPDTLTNRLQTLRQLAQTRHRCRAPHGW